VLMGNLAQMQHGVDRVLAPNPFELHSESEREQIGWFSPQRLQAEWQFCALDYASCTCRTPTPCLWAKSQKGATCRRAISPPSGRHWTRSDAW